MPYIWFKAVQVICLFVKNTSLLVNELIRRLKRHLYTFRHASWLFNELATMERSVWNDSVVPFFYKRLQMSFESKLSKSSDQSITNTTLQPHSLISFSRRSVCWRTSRSVVSYLESTKTYIWTVFIDDYRSITCTSSSIMFLVDISMGVVSLIRVRDMSSACLSFFALVVALSINVLNLN